MIYRPEYINAIAPFINAPVIKILAGIRRCGKSTILEMLRTDLIKRGISEEQIITRNYASMNWTERFSATDMYSELKHTMDGKIRYYLLLDELQEIDGWEKVVNDLFEKGNADIYVTGSNSKLMSSEISTYLSGRFVLIPVYTLSFKEYLSFKGQDNESVVLDDYIRFGGFPLIALGSYEQQSSYQISEGIYNTIIQNDISRRHRIKKKSCLIE